MKVTKWAYAKTYADAPHEYVLRDREPEAYTYYLSKLKTEGVREPFTLRGRTQTYRYYYDRAEGYKYWIIGRVLNRARIQPI